ncbi:hypothetical protein PsorP6_002956 [Peronosclerospora sorghi]|uniref:Uncharacterized protein n=1 Tax=Peronosclerospora sorghi TaxID=230839 RepID=A0ACC0VIZ3_9STRA|nr:hypothetical protein PsorP6_002956 [Peronosclerospora sorghi]
MSSMREWESSQGLNSTDGHVTSQAGDKEKSSSIRRLLNKLIAKSLETLFPLLEVARQFGPLVELLVNGMDVEADELVPDAT